MPCVFLNKFSGVKEIVLAVEKTYDLLIAYALHGWKIGGISHF